MHSSLPDKIFSETFLATNSTNFLEFFALIRVIRGWLLVLSGREIVPPVAGKHITTLARIPGFDSEYLLIL